jgi:hypothetical protein
MWINAGKWSPLEALLFGAVIVLILYAWARFESGERQPRGIRQTLHAGDRLADLGFAGTVVLICVILVTLTLSMGPDVAAVALGVSAAIIAVWLVVRARSRTARLRRNAGRTLARRFDDEERRNPRQKGRRGDR